MSTLQRIVLYGALTIASGFADLHMRSYPLHPVNTYIPQVLAGTSGAPSIYRVLMPFSVHGLSVWTGLSLTATWYLTRLACFFLAYLLIDRYLRTWYSAPAALGGTLLVAATLPLTFTNSWAHPDHIAELALFTLGCTAVAQRRDLLFAVALAVATLNRETAGFLVLLYFVAGRFDRRHFVLTLLFGIELVVVAGGLRLWRGFEHYEYWQLAKNWDFLHLLPPAYDPYYRAYAYFFLVLFGPLALIALTRYGEKPLFARRALWVVPPFLAVGLTISSIVETRIFTPLYPLLLPAVVAVVFGPFENRQSETLTAGRVCGG